MRYARKKTAKVIYLLIFPSLSFSNPLGTRASKLSPACFSVIAFCFLPPFICFHFFFFVTHNYKSIYLHPYPHSFVLLIITFSFCCNFQFLVLSSLPIICIIIQLPLLPASLILSFFTPCTSSLPPDHSPSFPPFPTLPNYLPPSLCPSFPTSLPLLFLPYLLPFPLLPNLPHSLLPSLQHCVYQATQHKKCP